MYYRYDGRNVQFVGAIQELPDGGLIEYRRKVIRELPLRREINIQFAGAIQELPKGGLMVIRELPVQRKRNVQFVGTNHELPDGLIEANQHRLRQTKASGKIVSHFRRSILFFVTAAIPYGVDVPV